jgi:hypothetical protein
MLDSDHENIVRQLKVGKKDARAVEVVCKWNLSLTASIAVIGCLGGALQDGFKDDRRY